MSAEFKIEVSPWADDENDCWRHELEELKPLFSYFGGGGLSSSYGDFWIKGNETGDTWELWQTYPDYVPLDEDEDEDEIGRERIFLSASCEGCVLAPVEAARILLRALWQVHKDSGYDHPNMVDSITEGEMLSRDEVEAIIAEVFL